MHITRIGQNIPWQQLSMFDSFSPQGAFILMTKNLLVSIHCFEIDPLRGNTSQLMTKLFMKYPWLHRFIHNHMKFNIDIYQLIGQTTTFYHTWAKQGLVHKRLQ